MASRARVEEQRRLNSELVALAQADLEAFWRGLDKSNIANARNALIVYTSSLVETYGRPAALVAATFYDDLRAASTTASGSYRAILADPPSAEQVAGSVRWAIGALDDGLDDGLVFERLSGAMQRFISQAGRDTIALNSGRDPSPGGWARVPTGATTCGFCLMLASRGPVYRSAETAGRATHYHDRCDCVPTQIWDGDDLPSGYDPDALYDEYRAARDAAESGSPDAISSVLDAGRPR